MIGSSEEGIARPSKCCAAKGSSLPGDKQNSAPALAFPALAMLVVACIQVALFLGAWQDPFGLMGYWYERLTRANNLLGLLALNSIASGIFGSFSDAPAGFTSTRQS